uniref:Uncharacterized protein n=1 Tax=Panagrolaimus sp. PS1159 TaxID=55785 RepID=A0AC35EUB7_9BILA
MEILLVFTKAKFKNGRIRITNGTNPTIFNKNKYSKAGYHHTDASMMIFDFSKNNTKSWEVFQGFITYEPGSTKLCPLANKDQPFKISNEAEPLYYDNDTELLHPIEILENDAYVFLPFSENENRSITFEFTSDESIIYKNFSIKFSSVECKCTEENFIIPCDEERTFTIMGGENELYCANLSCSSTIQIHDSCPDKSILLKLFPYFANPDCDYLHLINDKEVLINTSDISTKFDESTIQTALILPNRSTYFNFKSFSGTRIDKVR